MFGQVKWLVPVLTILIVLVTGCTGSEDAATNEMPEMIKVQFVVPEKATVQEPVALQIKLTQGGQPVEAADHVQFQVWNELDGAPEQALMTAEDLKELGALDASEVDKGLYEIQHTFEEPGTYIVQVHVTHGAMHSMPKKKIIVE